MNSDTEILVGEILAKAGAVEKCAICGNFMIATEDGDAEKIAYGMATNAWKDSERGFRGMEQRSHSTGQSSNCPRSFQVS